MLLGFRMFDLYVAISNKIPEVMLLYLDVLCVRSHLRRNRECNCPLIFFLNCDWIFEKTAQHCRGVSLKLEYKLNLIFKTHKS